MFPSPSGRCALTKEEIPGISSTPSIMRVLATAAPARRVVVISMALDGPLILPLLHILQEKIRIGRNLDTPLDCCVRGVC